MITPAWVRCFTSAALLITANASAIAAPTVIDFELAPPLTVVGPTQAEKSYVESGLTFTPSGSDAVVDLSFCLLGAESCISNNGGTYLTAINGSEVKLTASRAFSIAKLDAAFFPLPTPPGLFSGAAMGLKLTGMLWDGGTTETTFQLLEDSTSPGDFLFQNYDSSTPLLQSLTLSACAFTGATCVRGGAAFDAAGFLFNDLQFAIDNLSLTIPEPSALWLVALSLGGLVLTRRHVSR